MRRKILLLFASLLLAFCLAGCGNGGVRSAPENTEGGQTQETEPSTIYSETKRAVKDALYEFADETGILVIRDDYLAARERYRQMKADFQQFKLQVQERKEQAVQIYNDLKNAKERVEYEVDKFSNQVGVGTEEPQTVIVNIYNVMEDQYMEHIQPHFDAINEQYSIFEHP